MRVAILTSWFVDVVGGSGTAVFFNSLVSGLKAQGYEVEVISPVFDTLDYVQVTMRRFLFNAELAQDERVRSADVLIGFDYDGYGLLPGHRPPMITSAHALYQDVLEWESGAIRTMVEAQAFFDRVAMQRADLVTIGSEYGKNRIVDLYGISPEKIIAIPHGMPNPSWLPFVGAAPRTVNDHPILLFVGKMYPRKRIDILLRAVPLIRRDFPDVEVRIVGNGIDWDNLQAMVDVLSIRDNVTFLSHIADDVQFAAEWRQADVLCHPSMQETFGFVYLEGMLVGKAVVAARAGAAPEVLGDAAMLVEPDNAEAFAEGVALLLRDTSLRDEYARRARERAVTFTHELMMRGYIEAISLVV